MCTHTSRRLGARCIRYRYARKADDVCIACVNVCVVRVCFVCVCVSVRVRYCVNAKRQRREYTAIHGNDKENADPRTPSVLDHSMQLGYPRTAILLLFVRSIRAVPYTIAYQVRGNNETVGTPEHLRFCNETQVGEGKWRGHRGGVRGEGTLRLRSSCNRASRSRSYLVWFRGLRR